MYLGTHAFLPLSAINIVEILIISIRKNRIFSGWQLLLFGIAGMLPDLLWPHMSLKSRYASWTHTLWFLIILLPVVFVISSKTLKNNISIFAILFWLASVFHIVVDALSGGVAFFYPIDNIIGDYYIAYPLWIRSDIIFVSVGFMLLLVRYVLLKILRK